MKEIDRFKGVFEKERSMGNYSTSRSGIFPVSSSGWEEVSSVLAKAFSGDEDLRMLKCFDRENFPKFFQITCQFFLKSGKSHAWIFKQDGIALGAALCIPSNWSAPWGFLLSFFGKLWEEIRLKSFPFLFTLFKSAWLSKPRAPCLRIIFLGVVPSAWGKGIGRALLHKIFDEADFSRVQLEVERKNKRAVSLYLSEGFEKEREFKIGKVPFLVMVKDLPEKQKPNQKENGNQNR